MQKWEYKAVIISSLNWGQVEVRLNQLGAEGWELVAVSKASYYFKRPLSGNSN